MGIEIQIPPPVNHDFFQLSGLAVIFNTKWHVSLAQWLYPVKALCVSLVTLMPPAQLFL